MSEGTGRHIVVVGASLAGTKTAQGLRALGHVGPITLIGAESELPYDRPPLSKDLLAGEWTEAATDGIRLATAEELSGAGIDVRLGSAAIGLDTNSRTVTLADGSAVSYDALVIATGAVARPAPWQPESGLYQLRTLDDARAIATRLAGGGHIVVVGGGFIGTEIAAAALRKGCQVTVVDPVEEPMARLVGPEIARSLVDLHVRNGATTRFGVGVVAIGGQEGSLTVTLADGTELSATAAVVGIGSVACTNWLADAGLDLTNGVLTDGFLRVIGAHDVFAVGDVARFPHPGYGVDIRAEHWTSASDQARYVATALTAGVDEPFHPTDYVWSDQYDWKVHSVGRRDPEGTSTVVGDLTADGRTAVIHETSAGVVCGAVTVNWIRALNQTRRSLVAGTSAAEIVEQLRQLA